MLGELHPFSFTLQNPLADRKTYAAAKNLIGVARLLFTWALDARTHDSGASITKVLLSATAIPTSRDSAISRPARPAGEIEPAAKISETHRLKN
jgi:hypothetical protein